MLCTYFSFCISKHYKTRRKAKKCKLTCQQEKWKELVEAYKGLMNYAIWNKQMEELKKGHDFDGTHIAILIIHNLMIRITKYYIRYPFLVGLLFSYEHTVYPRV